MIIIKHIKNGKISTHMEFNKKIRAFRHAIYGLQKLRLKQLFPLIHRHKENKAIQRSLKISFRELLTKLQYYGSIN